MSKSPIPHLVPVLLIYFATRSSALVNNLVQENLTSKFFEKEATLNDPETFAGKFKDEKISPRYPTHSKQIQKTLRIKSTGEQEEMSIVDNFKYANFTRECDRGSQSELKMNNASYESISSSFNLREKRGSGFKITSAGQSPYSVLVVPLTKAFRPKRYCTGSLLTFKWVLTAAHCFREKIAVGHTQVIVYAGGDSYNDVVKKKYASGHQRSYAQRKNIFIHPHFRLGSYFYDIALIKMDRTFRKSGTVDVIKLSTQPWNYRGSERCRVVGFGRVPRIESKPVYGERKENIVEVMSPGPCFQPSHFRRYTISSKPENDNGHCTGDCLGAALVCQGEVKGVNSYGYTFTDVSSCKRTGPSLLECGSESTMTIFVPTCTYVDWVNGHVGLFNGKDIPSECKSANFQPVRKSIKTSSSTRHAYAVLWLWITLLPLVL